MDVSLYKNVDAANAIEFDLEVLIVSPVAHLRHVGASSVVLLVS